MRHVIPSQLDYRQFTESTPYGDVLMQRFGSFIYWAGIGDLSAGYAGRVYVNGPGTPTLYTATAVDGTSWDRETLAECAEALALHAQELAR